MKTTQQQILSHLHPLPTGRLLRFGSRVLRGVAAVQQTIIPYSQQWHESNLRELQKSGPVWVVLGDSMSQGIGASRYDRGWVGQLRDQLEAAGQHYRLINLSMSGARIEHVTNIQLPAMESIGALPDLVTILIGSNDMISPRYRKNSLENYRQMLDKLPNTKIVVSPFGDFGAATAINNLLREYDAEGKIIMANNMIRSWRGKLSQDHFHPNDRGYVAIAEIFAAAIQAKN